jgi:hypothetical protein
MFGYLAIARILLMCLFVSSGTCLPSNYLAITQGSVGAFTGL